MKKQKIEEEQIDAALATLMEFFEACQILATWEKDGNTMYMYRGRGNVFARQRMAEEYSDLGDSEEEEITFEPDEWDDDDEDDEDEDEIPH